MDKSNFQAVLSQPGGAVPGPEYVIESNMWAKLCRSMAFTS